MEQGKDDSGERNNQAPGWDGFPEVPRTKGGWGWAILFSLLLGLVYFLPHALFIIDCWPEYHYPFLGSGDERYYCALIRESGEGRLLPSSQYFIEHKGKTIPLAMSSAAIVALASKAVSLPLEQTAMVLDFLAPCGIFLMLYYLSVLLTGSVWLSIAGSTAVLLTSVVMLGLPNLLLVAILKGGAQLGLLGTYHGIPIEEVIPNTTFGFSRLINPQVNFFPFGAALIFLTLLMRKNRPIFAVALGICIGVLFYLAPFFWMYLFAGMGLLVLYLLMKKDYTTLKYMGLATCVALVVATPWFYTTYKFLFLPKAGEMGEVSRFALNKVPRQFVFLNREIIPILLFLVLTPRKDRLYFYLSCLLLGGWVCENQHIVTGLQFGIFKFVMYTDGPVVWVALFTMLGRWGAFKKGFAPVRWAVEHPRVTGSLCLAALFANGVGTQVIFYRADNRRPLPAWEVSAKRWKSYQAYHPAFEWLKEHGTDRDVVLASDEVSTLIPCLTQLNVLVNHFAFGTPTMPGWELHERWFLKLKFFGITPEEVRDYLDTHILMSTNTPTMWFIEPRWGKLSYTDKAAYEALLDQVSEDYAEFYKQDLREGLKRYHVTHIWLSSFEDEEFLLAEKGIDPARLPFLECVYKSDRVSIYAMKD